MTNIPDAPQPPGNLTQPDAAWQQLTPDQQALLHDIEHNPNSIVPKTQEEVDAFGPSDPTQGMAHDAGRLTWEKDVLKASHRVLSDDLAETRQAHAQTTAELDEKKKIVNDLKLKNLELARDLAESRHTATLNFKKVAELRDERKDLQEELEITQASLTHAEKEAELAIIDPLTGILNRRGLERKYNELIHAPQLRRGDDSNNHTSSVLFVDGDLFKEVNSEIGHDGGDEVLKIIAKTAELNIRPGDIVGRWGGDEFIVLLPNTDLDGATVVAEKIREAVSSVQGMPTKVTVSIGVDTIDRTQKLSKAARLADEAMDEAKNKGRDQVITVSRAA